MAATSLTLLEQLQSSSPGAAWDQFVAIYSPLLMKWNREAGLQESDAEDVAQETLTNVFQKIGGFSRQREGSFRKWLKKMAYHRVCRHRRKLDKTLSLEEADGSDLQIPPADEAAYAENYYFDVLESALRYVFKEFRELSWRAFLDTLLRNRPIQEVAAEIGISPTAIYIARCRIISRITQIAQGFIEDDHIPTLTMEMVERITDKVARNLSGRLSQETIPASNNS